MKQEREGAQRHAKMPNIQKSGFFFLLGEKAAAKHHQKTKRAQKTQKGVLRAKKLNL